ncbi:MAG TPA: hypothetical protein VH761_02670 [Ilumatobacteraceae bacterium]
MPDAAIAAAPPGTRARQRWRWVVLLPPVVAAALVIFATRHDPLLSPDSITYLSAADHIRGLHGITDFTLEPLTVFGPVFPLLLAPGGRSLLWARMVGGASIAAATTLMWLLLRRRVHPMVAVAAGTALGLSHGLVRIASVVWSEAPYAAVSLAGVLVLTRRPLTTRSAAVGGVIAGVGFLTRYAGAGLVITGLVIVVACEWNAARTTLLRRSGVYAGGAVGVIAIWVIRNVVETGQPLGPRFEGGTREKITETIRQAFAGTGHIVIGDSWSPTGRARLGAALLVAVVMLSVVALRGRRAVPLDLGMLTFALMSFLIPIAARRITANDIELRVMSPMLIPIVYFAAVTFDRLATRRLFSLAGGVVLVWWCYQGVAFAARFPDLAPGSSGYKPQFSPQLYDAIDALPGDAVILTNSPQRVWWFTDREPTLMGFTRPRPGNSHYPLDAADTFDQACSGHAYLAWFEGLQNAGDGPAERRPDLLEVVDLELRKSVPGGELYFLSPVDSSRC